MSWKRLQAEKKVKPHKTSKAELDELREAVEVKLRDAGVKGLSADTRFVTADGAALLLAKMAIMCSGYRLDAKTGGHHKTAFDALLLALGPSAKIRSDYFQVCRRKRNEIDYDRAYVASDADAEEIIKQTGELKITVESWIKTSFQSLV